MKTKAKKGFYEGKGRCPWCNKSIEIKVRKIIKTKAIKGEYEFRQILDKDSQTELP
jgi:hypothetical protein